VQINNLSTAVVQRRTSDSLEGEAFNQALTTESSPAPAR
jgi:hypothetical protein